MAFCTKFLLKKCAELTITRTPHVAPDHVRLKKCPKKGEAPRGVNPRGSAGTPAWLPTRPRGPHSNRMSFFCPPSSFSLFLSL